MDQMVSFLFCLCSRYFSVFDHLSLHLFVSSKASSTSDTSLKTASTTSEAAERFFKFVEKDQCDSIKVKRVPFIHRGTRASVDPKGNNFCILQIYPGIDLCHLPVVEKPTLTKDLQTLYLENDEILQDVKVRRTHF